MTSRRALLSILIAAALHALAYLVVTRLPAEVWWAPPTRVEVQLVSIPKTPEVPDEPDEPDPPPSEPPEPTPVVPPPAVTTPVVTPPVVPPPVVTPPVVTPPVAEPTPERPETGRPLVRLPEGEPQSMLGRVLGANNNDPFDNNLDDLSGALAFRRDGPLADDKRAASRALRNLQSDLAAGDVERGLADDYLRVLRNHIETSWGPAKRDLIDGGRDLDQLGLIKKTASSPEAFAEMWKAYQDIAAQYARGEKLRLAENRKQKLRELFRSRNGAFRFTAALEVTSTQAISGELLTLDTEISSGHPLFDERAKDALAMAVRAMTDPPPFNLHRGGQFKVRWRLRATWRMVPPTAVFGGTAFDITRKGVKADIPFEIKLKKRVLLVEYDNRTATREAP